MEINNKEKKEILIIHGWGSKPESWEKVKFLLEKSGYIVNIPALPGFGITPPPKEIWGAKEYAIWVKDNYLPKIKSEKIYLLGHSFGGAIAINLYTLIPEKFEKLILVAPAILRRKRRRINFVKKTIKAIRKFIYWETPKPVQKVLAKILGNYDYYKAEGVMKDIFKRVIKEDFSFLLPKIKIPTLLIWGDKDKLIPIEEAEIIRNSIKDSRLIILKNIGHNPHSEAPQIFSEKIKNFFLNS